ncbi:MAG: hypothetical protein N3D11_16235 [Candidatus Sumerlaeia bacterium]|nr:hypothetical protein [Candidatus Sumerlaeia bacterium]
MDTRTLVRWGIAAAAILIAQALVLAAFRGILADHCAWRSQRSYETGRIGPSVDWARRALHLNARQGYAHLFLGIVQREAGRVDEARQSFQSALRAMPHRADPLKELALCEEKAENTTTAAVLLGEALAVAPRPPDVGTLAARLGRLLFLQGRFAEGMARFRAALAESPRSRFLFDGMELGYEHFGAEDLAVAAALALSSSPQYAARGCERLLRLTQSPAQRPFILSTVQTLAQSLPSGSQHRETLEKLIRQIQSGTK